MAEIREDGPAQRSAEVKKRPRVRMISSEFPGAKGAGTSSAGGAEAPPPDMPMELMSEPPDGDWRLTSVKKASPMAMLRQTPFAFASLACTVGALTYGIMQFFQGNSYKQQMAMRARVGFQGMAILGFSVGVIWPAMKKRNAVPPEEQFFPTAYASGKVSTTAPVIKT